MDKLEIALCPFKRYELEVVHTLCVDDLDVILLRLRRLIKESLTVVVHYNRRRISVLFKRTLPFFILKLSILTRLFCVTLFTFSLNLELTN